MNRLVRQGAMVLFSGGRGIFFLILFLAVEACTPTAKTVRPTLTDAAPHPMPPVVTKQFFDGEIPDSDGFMDLASDHRAYQAGDLLMVSIPPKNRLPGMAQDKETRFSAFVVRTLPGGRMFIMVRQTIREQKKVLRYVITGWINRSDLGPDNTLTSNRISDMRYRLDTPTAIKESSFEKRRPQSRALPKVKPATPTKPVSKTTAPEAGPQTAQGGQK